MKNEVGDKRGLGISYHELATISLTRGNFKKAIEQFNESIKIKKKIFDKFGIARSNASLGESYYRIGDFSEALHHYTEAYALMNSIGDKRGAIYCLLDIAKIHEVGWTNCAFINQRSCKKLGIHSQIRANKPCRTSTGCNKDHIWFLGLDGAAYR